MIRPESSGLAWSWPPRWASTAFFTLLLLASWVAPRWPLEQAMHTALTVLALGALWAWRQHLALSRRDHALIMLFLALHTVAARWLYSNVPYDPWLQAWLGFSLDHWMGWQRNQFDRLVHLAWGLCLTPPIHSWARARIASEARQATVVAVCAIMVSGLCYEWFEWLVAVVLSPEEAEAYNGQQGDIWDAHKDMLLATLGALIWVPKLWRAPPQPR
jgi:putative membrane protein